MNNRSITAALSIVFFLFLSGCAGSGVKDVSQFIPLIDTTDESAVLIVRQTGFQGSGALVEVVVDGVVVGDLGNKEILAHRIPAGEHSVLVRFKGIGGLGLNKVMKTFTLENGEKGLQLQNLSKCMSLPNLGRWGYGLLPPPNLKRFHRFCN